MRWKKQIFMSGLASHGGYHDGQRLRWTAPKCARAASRFMAACRSSHGNPLVGGPGHVLDPARVVGTRDARLDDFAIVDDRRISDDLPRAVEIREAITDAELDREEHVGPFAVGSWLRRHLFPSRIRACADGTSSYVSGVRSPPARAK